MRSLCEFLFSIFPTGSNTLPHSHTWNPGHPTQLPGNFPSLQSLEAAQTAQPTYPFYAVGFARKRNYGPFLFRFQEPEHMPSNKEMPSNMPKKRYRNLIT